MSKKFKIWLNVLIIWTCLSLGETGPIQRYIRVMREVYPEIEPEKVEGNQPQVCVVGDVVYEAEEPVPADQPCLKCKCQPPGVHCETTRCLKKPGCRAIHKPNKCCPDYQCECEHEGKTYANGERLESKPGGECQVCYCRGGEVQCTEVSCYIRTDCEGKTVPGQCCPKYEHCPAIEPVLGKIPQKPEVDEHETTTKVYADAAINASAENEIGETTLSFDKEENIVSSEATTQTPKSIVKNDADISNVPKITIHEIIPEVKEIPITEPPKQENTSVVQGHLLVEEKVPTTNDENALENHANDVEDSDLESSELSEVFQHPPPVLRIGDKLLFLKKGELVPEKDASTPSPVFTIIGAEGLQRGDIESVEHHDGPKEYENLATSSPPTLSAAEDVSAEAKDNGGDLGKEESEKNSQVSTTSLKKTAEDITESTSSENTLKNEDNASIEVAVELATGNFDVSNENGSESSPPSSETAHTTRRSPEDEQKLKVEEIQLENPAYPPIPEIMSQQGVEYIDHGEILENISKDSIDIESSTVDTKILPEVLPFRRNDTELENATNASWLKSDGAQSLVNEKAILPEEILKEIAPSDLDTTTDAISLTTNVNKQERRSFNVETDIPIEAFKDEDLLKYGSIVERDPLVENQVKKLADDEDVVGSLLRISQDRPRSTEMLENSSGDYSGENTTPNTARRASTSNEDASIEGYKDTKELSSTGTDVEIIDTTLMTLNGTKTNLTHEENSKESQVSKDVEKRTVNYDTESDKIFQELDTELHLLDNSHVSTKSEEEEKKEAEIIFKELLDEVNSSTSKTPKETARNADSDVLQRVSDAIAKFQLKEARQSLDVGVLGILRDFFTSQYRSYKDI